MNKTVKEFKKDVELLKGKLTAGIVESGIESMSADDLEDAKLVLRLLTNMSALFEEQAKVIEELKNKKAE